ncbi:inositol monophosphatase family protein [Halorarum salinum]|uniref:fructose-bisphosphatase n=1 Tax=Halorarum salinum TaxID=2743089 RepID=A0A7D5LBR3_9EURY|nr:inositol monophosphatase [Halobaculum salinum]QLG62751.1 inositol monophosphatase [Halobaculum salinum]
MSEQPGRAAVAEQAARAGAAVAAKHFRIGIDVETKAEKTDVVTAADRAAQRRVIETVRESFPDDAFVGEEESARGSDGETAEVDVLKEVPPEGPVWVIDPIDGTNNYVRDIRVFATAVAAVVDGEPVAAANVLPAMDDAYVADGDATYRNGERVTVSDVDDPERGAVAPTIWWGRDRRDEYAAACSEIVRRFADLRRFGSAQATLPMVADGSLEGTVTNVACNPWDTVAGVHMIRNAGGTVTDLNGDRWTHDSRGLVASNGELHDEVLAAARGVDAVRD